jgi:tRNA(fMet)-specific endonuclease VapC
MIFLDSDILSYYFSGNTKIHEKIKNAIDADEKIVLTVINVYEILKGFKWRQNKNKELLFNKFLETVSIYAIDDSVIELATDIYADLRRNGITISDADILIAAIVIRNNGKLISNNTNHYKDIKKLDAINWLE